MFYDNWHDFKMKRQLEWRLISISVKMYLIVGMCQILYTTRIVETVSFSIWLNSFDITTFLESIFVLSTLAVFFLFMHFSWLIGNEKFVKKCLHTKTSIIWILIRFLEQSLWMILNLSRTYLDVFWGSLPCKLNYRHQAANKELHQLIVVCYINCK